MSDPKTGRARVLVLGMGNPDRGDDGVGFAVAEVLSGALARGVALKTRSGDMFGLLDDWSGYDAVICVDAAAPMGTPGGIHRIDARRDPLPAAAQASSHGIGLAEALALASALGTAPATLVVYAVEGLSFEPGVPLSPLVSAAVAEVTWRVRAEAERLLELNPEAAHA